MAFTCRILALTLGAARLEEASSKVEFLFSMLWRRV